nr:ABC transporter permease [uncultured Catonella sp.]
MNKKKSILQGNVLYTVIAIIIGFLIGAVFLIVAGISPVTAYEKLLSSVFSKPKYMIYTLVYAAPIILTGLSVAFSFKTGVFNIGVEGQFVVGSIAATLVGILLKLPAIIHVLLCIISAMAAGAVWSLICGIMKVKRGIHEVLSFIMFNWIAFYLSNFVVNLKSIKVTGGEASKNLEDSARLLFPDEWISKIKCPDANWGIVIAVSAAVIIWIIIEKTTLGYKLKAVGFNKHSAEYAGIDANKSILTALCISGALAGLGGAVQTMGQSGRIVQFAGQEGYGFEGISVALIGSSNPIGCIFAGLFYGAMKFGGSKLNIVQVPSQIINIIMGCVIIFIAISHIFKYLLLKFTEKKEA